MAHIINNVSLNKSVYSILDIAKYEKIPKERINALMQNTLDLCVRYAPNKTANGICEWFNNAGVKDNNINMFLTHTRLKPFAKGIRLNTERCIMGKGKADFMMFSVSKSIYHNWHYNKIPYNADVAQNPSEIGIINMKTSSKSVRLPQSDMLTHFINVVKRAGFSTSEGILAAIKEYMVNHADAFGNDWKPTIEDVDERELQDNRVSLVMAKIDPDINNQMYKAIQRYNKINYPYIRVSDFIQSAIEEKLDRLPIQYTDPELYKEMQQIKEIEERYL